MVKTLVYVVGAALLAVVAWVAQPADVRPEVFSDKGEDFFPGFQEPSQAVALEVVEFDAAQAALKPFRIQSNKGRWTIPSHHNYPADAQERMAKAAGLFIGLKKEDVRTDSPSEHKSLGVVDPTSENPGAEGLGAKVTFSDSNGNTLASLIIGKEVKDRADRFYVRVPDKKRVYVATLPTKVSAKFEDWIETDILKVNGNDIRKLLYDTSSVDEAQERIVKGEQYELVKKEHAWTTEKVPEGKELKSDVVDAAVATLDTLKIVGVRAKPQGLSAQLTRSEGMRLTMEDVQSLAHKGFFIVDGTLYSNEGDLAVVTSKGVVYVLRFGEIVFGSGLDVTAGADEKPPRDSDPPKTGEGKENRYLMITASFDESRLDKPKGTPLPEEHLAKRKKAREAIEKIRNAVETFKTRNDGKLPETLAKLTEGENAPLKELAKDPWENAYVFKAVEDGKYEILSSAADRAEGGAGENGDISSSKLDAEDALRKEADDHKEHQRKVTEGREEAKRLSARFAPWYYVIDNDSFKKIHVAGEQLFKEKGKEEKKEPPKEPQENHDHDHEK